MADDPPTFANGIERVAGADGVLLKRRRAVKVVGGTFSDEPDTILTGTSGGEGEVVGVTVLTIPTPSATPIVARVTTTDATPVLLYAVPLANESIAKIRWTLFATKASTHKASSFERQNLASRVAGTIAVDLPVNPTLIDDGTELVTDDNFAVQDTGSGGVGIYVSGIAATTIKWTLQLEVLPHSF